MKKISKTDNFSSKMMDIYRHDEIELYDKNKNKTVFRLYQHFSIGSTCFSLQE